MREPAPDAYGAVLYTRWLAMWNGDLDLANELTTRQCKIHQAPFGTGRPARRRGPAAMRTLVEQGRAPFTDITFGIEVGPFGDGVFLAARWVAEGAYAGGLPGAPAKAGTKVTLRGTDIMRREAGQVAEYWVGADGAHLMAQLGMLEPAKA